MIHKLMKLIIIILITNWTIVTGVKKGEKFTTKYILQELEFLIKDLGFYSNH